MSQTSTRLYSLIKAAFAAGALPLLFVYVMIAKPDYRIMNGMAHVVLPVAHFVGDVVTWPVRACGAVVQNVHELSNLRAENEELRAALDTALSRRYECDVAILENQKMAHEIDAAASFTNGAIIADVMHDNAAFHHSTYFIRRGTRDGVAPGMAVISPDGMLAGIVIDAGPRFSRVRALTDSDTNIAVRVAGSDVYGFVHGNGAGKPSIGFFSDPQFQATDGLKLITSSISGVLPDGIYVGETVNKTDVKIMPPRRLSRVMVLRFNGDNKYE